VISRDSDVIARMSGDEFVILFADACKKTAKSIVSRFKSGLEQRKLKVNPDYQIGFSHGIVEFYPDVHSSIGELLNAGDELMYAQKHQQ